VNDAERWTIWAILPLLIAAGVFGWMSQLREPYEVDASGLAGLPMTVDTWLGRDLEIDSGIEDMLAADFHVNRAYIHRFGDIVWFYMGYYGTERGGRPEHTPWACYPSNGWEIVSSEIVEIAPGLEANELLVEKDGQQRIVFFWYQSHRRGGMLGGLDQAVDRFVSRLSVGRADGSLVRLSTPLIDDDRWAARSRLMSFGREIAPKLSQHWPIEIRAEGVPAPEHGAARPEALAAEDAGSGG
jgi:EpsI family protein